MAFAAADCVDELAIFIAPKKVDLGGKSDISRLMSPEGVDITGFTEGDTQQLGPDIYMNYTRHPTWQKGAA